MLRAFLWFSWRSVHCSFQVKSRFSSTHLKLRFFLSRGCSLHRSHASALLRWLILARRLFGRLSQTWCKDATWNVLSVVTYTNHFHLVDDVGRVLAGSRISRIEAWSLSPTHARLIGIRRERSQMRASWVKSVTHPFNVRWPHWSMSEGVYCLAKALLRFPHEVSFSLIIKNVNCIPTRASISHGVRVRWDSVTRVYHVETSLFHLLRGGVVSYHWPHYWISVA